jgi:hypothetical protein
VNRLLLLRDRLLQLIQLRVLSFQLAFEEPDAFRDVGFGFDQFLCGCRLKAADDNGDEQDAHVRNPRFESRIFGKLLKSAVAYDGRLNFVLLGDYIRVNRG